jgi:beta-galactosidase/beta-glucuronidase
MTQGNLLMTNTRNTLSLAGKWDFKLDPHNQGIKQRWFDAKLPETIVLPGTTDEAGYGELTNEACADRLSRVYRWIGPAWYQRVVNIPTDWKGKKIFLFLERTKDSQVWIDGKWAGSDNSLSTPHEFDLSKHLTPGKHTLTILIDNAKLPPVGPCHQVDERTQTNWNGILGEINLIAKEPVWIQDLQAYP